MIIFVRWVCDRCHYEYEVTEDGQPPGWLGLELYVPPLATEPAQGMRFHLCGSCQADVATLFQRGE